MYTSIKTQHVVHFLFFSWNLNEIVKKEGDERKEEKEEGWTMGENLGIT